MWLEIIENARASESRSGNKYGGGNSSLPPGLAKFMGQAPNRTGTGGVVAASMDSKNNFYYDNQDDESLDNYMDAQDVDTVTQDKSYVQPSDYYYTG